MIKVKVTAGTELPIIKQTPGRTGVWKNYQFFINDDTYDCDYWFVLYNVSEKIKAKCSNSKIYFLNAEPESIHVYDELFIRQFKNLITCQKNRYNVDNIFYQQIGATWMVGDRYNAKENKYEDIHDKDYDELKSMEKIEKTKLLSVIASSKNFTAGHRKRLQFVEVLKERFKGEIDIFGRGINTFSDKWDTIAPYKYHIVIENACHDDYFTEKLTDSFLGQSYPIYYGCPNLEKYYNSRSFTRIDINNPEHSVNIIENSIKEDLYEHNYEYIMTARDLVLDKHNVFNLMVELMETNNSLEEKSEINLYPERYFQKKYSMKRLLKKWFL